MSHKKSLLVVFTLLSSVSLTAEAKNSDFAVGLNLSTLGIGLRGEYKINQHWSTRAFVNYASIGTKITDGLLQMKPELKFLTLGAAVDLHPFENGFFLSGGLLYNDNHFSVKTTPTADITIYGNTYTPAQMGHIKGKLSFNKLSPYLGLGYSNTFTEDGSWYFFAELGAMFQGQMKAKVSATGTFAANQLFLDDMTTQMNEEIKDVVKFLNVWPVLSIGLTYRF